MHRSLLPRTQNLHHKHTPSPTTILSFLGCSSWLWCFFPTTILSFLRYSSWLWSLMPLPGPMLSACLALSSIIHPDVHCPAPPATLVSLVLSEKTGAVSTIRTVTAQQTSRADGESLMAYTMPTNKHSSPPRIPSYPKARLILPPPRACPGPMQFTTLSPVSSWSPPSARTGKSRGPLLHYTSQLSTPSWASSEFSSQLRGQNGSQVCNCGPRDGRHQDFNPHLTLRSCTLNSVPSKIMSQSQPLELRK